ncbi:hypothetical protein AwDysgo_16190 [Bacteroidales bacterium]|nr:hypothetical protein AwDysgo_16190 [Bacteroidales bacterium]
MKKEVCLRIENYFVYLYFQIERSPILIGGYNKKAYNFELKNIINKLSFCNGQLYSISAQIQARHF